MHAETTLTLIGQWPDDLQVGQVLEVTGAITVHTIHAELVDTSSYGNDRSYAPAVKEVGAYSNKMTFAAKREP